MRNRVESETANIDISKIPSKAAEMGRLFSEAEDAIVRLLAFAGKLDVIVGDGRVLWYALHSLEAREDGHRVVNAMWDEGLIEIPVSNIDDIDASRRAIAESFGVTTQELARYERNKHGIGVEVECNHAGGCRRSKPLFYGDPAAMLRAERQAAQEIWYCADHREIAFVSEGALADEMLPVLQRIKATPGLTQTDTGAKREDLAFLESIGLIKIDKTIRGGRTLVYSICMTEAGDGFLRKHDFLGGD